MWRDPKTTIFGLVAAFFGFVIFAAPQMPGFFPQWLQLLSAFAAAGGLLGLGITAAQSRNRGNGGKSNL